MLVRVPGAVFALCCSALGAFYIKALYFSLWWSTCSKVIFSSEYLSVLFLKNHGFSLKCLPCIVCYIGDDFLYVSLALWFSILDYEYSVFSGKMLLSILWRWKVLDSSPTVLEKTNFQTASKLKWPKLGCHSISYLTLLNISPSLQQFRILLFYIHC